jgi:GntR family transcriptional regulator
MHLHITNSDGVPIYQQIVQQIKSLVAAGRLAPGEELPPIRVLAEQLVINANTVARAYRELGAAGVLTNRRTAGTYVADDASPLARAQCLELLADRVDALLVEARQMNIDLEEVLQLIRRRDQALRPHPEEK